MTTSADAAVIDELLTAFPEDHLVIQPSADGIPTVWVEADRALAVLGYLKRDARGRYPMLFDLTAIDERTREHRAGQPDSDFTLVYHLLSLHRNADLRVKVALTGEAPALPTATGLFPSADWYEREVWDLFGLRFDGHPNLRRILLPPTWQGHPLRKDAPARATEMEPFELPPEREDAEQRALVFDPEQWGLERGGADADYLFLNVGPQHPGTHGVLRVVLQLEGEEVVAAVPDIGYHHRGAEKMAERQTWHTFLPYTDRIDYLGGVMNNLPYLLAIEALAGIEVPERVEVCRVMLCELFRVLSHLVWLGTFGNDVGAISPVFYTLTDREHGLDVVAAITGDRMHPHWFRIGGLVEDLPEGWEQMMRTFVSRTGDRIEEYDRMIIGNRIFQARTKGVGQVSRNEAIEWGMTGPMLRATGLDWDLRKRRPYSGYDRFDFDVPIAHDGDCFARSLVHMEEMRQSLRIIEQCIESMPAGPHKADHPLTTPPPKPRTMKDIETLITHFLAVSWGPVLPPGECCFAVEASKGINAYSLISDGSNTSYRTRIRTPSFAHLQTLPLLSRGHTVADVLTILGSIDYVLADVDR